MNVSSEINWVGLGSMDSRMAPNLVKKGYDVTRFDIDRTRVSAAAAPGLTEAPTLSESDVLYDSGRRCFLRYRSGRARYRFDKGGY
jgi:6-phosphogluconate dehydrogenase (decarboxylating)